MKYLVILLVIMSCTTRTKQQRTLTNEKLDTIRIVPPATGAQPLIFEQAFSSGVKARGHNAVVNLTGITIGKIKIPSGRLIACDPMLTEEYGKTFTQTFPTGEFPVQLSVVKLDYVEAIGFARISFSDEPVARWELALLKDQKPLPVGGSEKHKYIVDSGMGSFMDSVALKSVEVKSLSNIGGGLYKEMDKHIHYSWKYGIYNFGQNTIAGFTAGLGDNYYATYIGYDNAGRPCRLLTDFDLVNWEK